MEMYGMEKGVLCFIHVQLVVFIPVCSHKPSVGQLTAICPSMKLHYITFNITEVDDTHSAKQMFP